MQRDATDLPQTGWMTSLMEAKEPPDPEDASLLGLDAVVLIPDALADSIENRRRFEHGIFRRPHNTVADTVRKNCTVVASGRVSVIRMRRRRVLCDNGLY